MKVLITGSNGMLGQAVQRSLRKHDLICPRRHELNVGNFEQVIGFVTKKPDFIVHLSSETDHEYCDINPAQCYFINTIGTANVTKLAEVLNVPIVYVSTASIFDGKKGKPYNINDKPNPINHYNKSKYFGELMVMDYDKHFILRAGWLFGGGKEYDKKFVNKIMKKVFAGQKEIKVATDCVGSPTYTHDLADIIGDIIENSAFSYGKYNAVNYSEGVSRWEFAQEIKNILNLDVEMVKCSIDDLTAEFPCKRTNYEVLETDLAMPNWKKSLRGYMLANYKS